LGVESLISLLETQDTVPDRCPSTYGDVPALPTFYWVKTVQTFFTVGLSACKQTSCLCDFSAPSPCRAAAFHFITQEGLMFSNPTGSPFFHRDDERRHAVSSHSALVLRLYLTACNPSSFEHIELPVKLLDYFLRNNKSNINHSSCCFKVLDHLCSNLSTAYHHDSVSLLLNHGNLIFEPVCVF